MEDLYRTPLHNGARLLDADEVTVFQTPNKGLIDTNKHPWKNPSTPATGLPCSNRDNVVDALKNIQDRIRALEIERTTAEENLKDLSKETNIYRQSLDKLRAESAVTKDVPSPQHYSPTRSFTSGSASKKQYDLQEQLKLADSRCELLDKQLDYMRKMLNEAEAEKRLAYERSEQMTRLRNTNVAQDLKAQMDKIAEMEREQQKLHASQTVAQERIIELEKALEATRNKQKTAFPNNLSSELKSAAKSNKILIEKLSPPCSPEKEDKKPRRNRRKKALDNQPKPGQHYRLNMADIPFVVGQSTMPSHRFGSNVQNVIALMKSHNRELCSAAGQKPRTAPRKKSGKRDKIVIRSDSEDSSENETELQDMMDQLTEEYTHMSAEHHEMTRQLDTATSYQTAADLQHELEKLEIRMSAKADQIAKLSAHQNKLREKKSRAQSASERSSSLSRQAREAYKVPSSSTTGEVQVTTTIKTKGPRADKVIETQCHQSNLKTLRSIKTLKTKLKPDDLRWTT